MTAIFLSLSGSPFSSIQFRILPVMREMRSSIGATSLAHSSPTITSCTPETGIVSMHPSSSGQITAAIVSIGESPVGDSSHFVTSRVNMGAGEKMGTFRLFNSSSVRSGFPPRGPPFIRNHIRLMTASTMGSSSLKKYCLIACRL